jgi:hypothetical protein
MQPPHRRNAGHRSAKATLGKRSVIVVPGRERVNVSKDFTLWGLGATAVSQQYSRFTLSAPNLIRRPLVVERSVHCPDGKAGDRRASTCRRSPTRPQSRRCTGGASSRLLRRDPGCHTACGSLKSVVVRTANIGRYRVLPSITRKCATVRTYGHDVLGYFVDKRTNCQYHPESPRTRSSHARKPFAERVS